MFLGSLRENLEKPPAEIGPAEIEIIPGKLAGWEVQAVARGLRQGLYPCDITFSPQYPEFLKPGSDVKSEKFIMS
jgi:hypothetical protein